VVARLADAVEDDLRPGVAVEPETHDAVVGVGGVVRVHPPVLGVVGRDREAQQPALATHVDARHLVHPARLAAARRHLDDAAGVALGDEGIAVRQKRHPPRHVEPAGHLLRRAEVRRAAGRAAGAPGRGRRRDGGRRLGRAAAVARLVAAVA
jgi:hypothetical protein